MNSRFSAVFGEQSLLPERVAQKAREDRGLRTWVGHKVCGDRGPTESAAPKAREDRGLRGRGTGKVREDRGLRTPVGHKVRGIAKFRGAEREKLARIGGCAGAQLKKLAGFLAEH